MLSSGGTRIAGRTRLVSGRIRFMNSEQRSVDGSPSETSSAPAAGVSSPVRAVIYARVSSLAQRDQQTIASQLEALPKFVSLRGWNLVRPADTYVDDGRTAKAGFLAE